MIHDPALLGAFAWMRDFAQPWWIAGGWAIDLHLDEASRCHQDVDVAVLRRDQHVLRRHLHEWRFEKRAGGTLSIWPEHEHLELPVHEIHASKGSDRLELLLNESADDRWLFRRNVAISMPLARMSRRHANGIPYLSPEVVLLYKAKEPRAHDHSDFGNVLPTLESGARSWLADALQRCHPSHEWLAGLGASAGSEIDQAGD